MKSETFEKQGGKEPLMEDAKSRSKLTREQLMELEERVKTPRQKFFDKVFLALPPVMGAIALAEYNILPDLNPNPMPYLYTGFLTVLIAAYIIALIAGTVLYSKGNKKLLRRLRYKAPLYTVLLIIAIAYDLLTIKFNYFTYPMVPCVNSIFYAMVTAREILFTCAVHTLRLMMAGYFIGVVLGLITGISCGYSERCRYWVEPVIKFMGPIPISTWIPIIMVFTAGAMEFGALFIVVIGVWFAVTVASMAGVANVDRSYFDAARILGATERQLIFRVAIPHAMPNIMAGMTQGMSTACTAIMVAEMLAVEAGLGWYITWVRAWALYNNVFASLIVICLIFTVVTKALAMVKARVLRWQTGVTK